MDDTMMDTLMVDMDELDIRSLATSNDSVLARCSKRVMKSLEDPDGIISAFQSFASVE